MQVKPKKIFKSKKNEEEIIVPLIDDGLYTYFTNSDSNNAVTLKMWGAKELLVSGSRAISASVKGNLSNAENVIVKSVPTAWAVTATNCDMRFGGSTEVRFNNNEMKPKNKSTYISFSIPLPGGQSYNVNWTVNSVEVSTEPNDKVTEWNMWNINGIKELLNTSTKSGAGFQNMMYCVPSSVPTGGSKNFTLAGRAWIGYRYAYIDATGQMNSATKYFETSGSTTMKLVNPA